MLEWIENHCVGVVIVSIVCCFLWGKRITEYYVGSAEIWAEMVSSCSEGVESLESQIFGKSQPQSQPVQEVVAPPKTYLELGNECYENGEFTDARKYYEMAASQGSAEAQYKLAICYELGRGGKTDLKSAVYYYGLAAKQGYPGAEQKRAEVQERLKPKMCMKCRGKGSVTVPEKECDNCTNGTVEMPCECSLGKYDPRRSFYQGLCNGFAGVYPNPRVRWGYLSKKNQKNLLDCKRISKDDETLDVKTIFDMNFNFADRFDDREFLRNLDSQGILSRLGRNLGCLHIVYCMDYHFKKKKLFGKYKCENLNNLVQNVQSDSKCNNYCDKCKLCNKCGGNILCNICQGRLVRYEDCKNCENGVLLQREETCPVCKGKKYISPEIE